MVTRRAFLATAATAVVAGRTRPGLAGIAPRIAAIDWAMAETAMALGHPPAAMAELIGFRRATPLPLASEMIDLGLRGAPNLEALSLSDPDLILSSSYYSFVEPQLSRIAPVFSRALYVTGEDPLPKLLDLLTDLAAAIGSAAAPSVLSAAMEAFDISGVRLSDKSRACVLLEIGDARHIRIFGHDSMFGGTLLRLGLQNAWTDVTQFAFNAPVPMERLADFPNARLVIVGAVPEAARRALKNGVLWNRLAPVLRGDVHHLPAGNAFGGLPSALRFARDLVTSLTVAA